MGTVKQEAATVLDESTSQRIEARIQEKVNSGYTAPCGWLFRGLSFFFFSPVNRTNEKDGATTSLDLSLKLLQNTARFARANIATSVKAPGITHAIVNSETASPADLASLRKSVAALPGRKVPHLVTSKWVEESWKNGTLLDEERK
jgi:DNA ligase-4